MIAICFMLNSFLKQPNQRMTHCIQCLEFLPYFLSKLNNKKTINECFKCMTCARRSVRLISLHGIVDICFRSSESSLAASLLHLPQLEGASFCHFVSLCVCREIITNSIKSHTHTHSRTHLLYNVPGNSINLPLRCEWDKHPECVRFLLQHAHISRQFRANAFRK
jgi:hypothetical protein